MVKQRKMLIGEVISNKMEKTVVVKVQRTIQHPRYGKVLRQQTKLKAHDEKKECLIGDRVRLVECRPMSRDKHWRVGEILVRSEAAEPVLNEGMS